MTLTECPLPIAYWRTEFTDMRQPRDKVARHYFLAGAGPRAEGLDSGVPLTGRFSPFGGITGLSPVAMSMIDLASWLGSLGRLGWLVIPAFCLDVQ
jgi:hypothetical protein